MSDGDDETIEIYETGLTPPADRTVCGAFDQSRQEPLIWLTANELLKLKGKKQPTNMGYYRVDEILHRVVGVPGLELVVRECIKTLDEGIGETQSKIRHTLPGKERRSLARDEVHWRTLKLEGRTVGLWKKGNIIHQGTLEFGGGPREMYVGGWAFDIEWDDFVSRKFEVKELGAEEVEGFVEISRS